MAQRSRFSMWFRWNRGPGGVETPSGFQRGGWMGSQLPSGKRNDHIAGKSPFSIGSTSTQSGFIFQPAMLVYQRVDEWSSGGGFFSDPHPHFFSHGVFGDLEGIIP